MNKDEKIVSIFKKEDVDKTSEENHDVWQCGACNVIVNDQSEKKVLPIAMGGDPRNPQSAITFYVCPNCYTIQMPEQIFEVLSKRLNSRIKLTSLESQLSEAIKNQEEKELKSEEEKFLEIFNKKLQERWENKYNKKWRMKRKAARNGAKLSRRKNR